MSMSRTALKMVCKSLPHLRLCNDVLVLPPTEHILRGYEFERTPYKGTFYLWRMVVPLYRPQSHLILEYSERIPRGDYVHLSRENPRESAAVVTKIISDDLSNLERIRTPRDFLDHNSWMASAETPTYLFDLALTYHMVGSTDDAVATLERAGMAAEKTIAGFKKSDYFDSPVIPRMNKFCRTIRELAATLKSNPAKATEILSNWERTNIAQFDLTETRSAA